MKEHVNDSHVQRAQADGYRSRAVYKLIELDEKDQLIKPSSIIVELGAAPGGWTQYLASKIGPEGKIIASDILPMDSVAGSADAMIFILGDFTEQSVADAIEAEVGKNGADLVLSDMAPNLSGVASSDQARAMGLVEMALDTASRVLNPEGAFVAKVFQGEGFDSFVRELRSQFQQVKIRKPDASRSRSREVYVVARNLI